MTITLEAIEAKQSEISALIEGFKKQSTSTTVEIAASTITLAPGERYAGLVLDEDGTPSHHLILLPSDADGSSWGDATAWADKQGGGLPTRREQSLLFANLKGEFQSAYYWSNETHESDSAYAWYQGFDGGSQHFNHKDDTNCRARAVRRLVIE
ncbi:DUF1566 domain-containing protein [Paraburkholderia sp. C35]|uniref:DUF1566 domain-containing protein n=1 Tax=Paraburkholderia sp. C35 TaxID=2126993 RepID=UPI000D69B126|nr:DUF1566 domain-containing protein [Paraburkholderia sp. C35]